MRNGRYLLWDFDGTLAYRDGMWTDTLLSVLYKNNITNIEKDELRPFLNIGFSWHSPDASHYQLFNGKKWWDYHESYFQEIYEKLGVCIDDSRRISKQVKDEYIDITKWHVFPDTINALEVLMNNGYSNIVLSNHIPELEQIVNNLHLQQYFIKVYTSGIIGYEKPNKQIFDFVVNDLSADRTHCVMIGDSYDADIAGALRSNIKSILVRKDNTKNYKWYSKDLKDIPELIKKIS